MSTSRSTSFTLRRRRLSILAAALLLLIAACGGEDGGGGDVGDAGETAGDAATAEPAGSIAAGYDLSGLSATVGSKEFTEQLVLGEITIQALEAAGADVSDETGLVGSTTVREALLAGEIDMYWEYTGTGWITHLGNVEPIPGPQEQYDAVAEADAANDITWLEPAPFNNTYAIALGPQAASEAGITRLSELSAFLDENPDMGTLCAAAEFLTRDDGLPGLEEAYGFDIADADIVEMELGLVYPTVASGEDCTLGEVFATDGRVAALDLQIIEDDEEFFASYLPSLNVRTELADEHPDLAGLFSEIAAALDTDTIRALNARVDVDGEQPQDVARDFLVDGGFTS
jgi:osmoprotectant transport system substrate-binding protein